jgi:hypothetical protein
MDGQDSLMVEVYKAYIEDVNQLRSSRATLDNLYVTILTILLGAQAYVANLLFSGTEKDSVVAILQSLNLENWIPAIGAAVIGAVGSLFCSNWSRISADNKRSLNFKYKNLEEMEQKWPVLQRVGAQLFIEEFYDRHPDRRPPSTDKGKTPVEDPARSSIQRGSNRGISARAAELQQLFRNVFLLLGTVPLIVKTAVVLWPWITLLAQHVWTLL